MVSAKAISARVNTERDKCSRQMDRSQPRSNRRVRGSCAANVALRGSRRVNAVSVGVAHQMSHGVDKSA